MLKIGEAIMVGDSIRITVLEIRGDKVRLGIVAPDEVTVDRQEVHEERMNSLGEEPVLTPTTSLSEDLLFTCQ